MQHPIQVKGFIYYLKKNEAPLLVVFIAMLSILMVESPMLRILPTSHLNALLWYALVPLACIALLQKRSPSLWGWHFPHYKLWIKPCLLYLAVALPLIALGSLGAPMNDYYQKETFNWQTHLLTTALYMLGWEYFFRGFLLEGLRHHFKEGAIILQMIPFTLLHLGKPDIEVISCVFSGIVWGYICYQLRSFWPAFIMHMIVNLFTVLWINVL